MMEILNTTERRVYENSFNVNGELHDLVLSKNGEIFKIAVKDTNGRLYFHEQEIAEQLNIKNPTIDDLIKLLSVYYTTGLNIRRSRDFQIKLLVEGCPQLFSYARPQLLA